MEVRPFACFFALLTMISFASAQTATPVAPAAPFTLSVNTQLVLVDVTVRDRKGNAVHGLKQSDFTLLENGVPQTLRSFEEHTGLTAAEATKVPPTPKLPPGNFTNYVSTPPSGALNLILIDRLNTSVIDQQYMLQQLKEYAKHVSPDARTAIFGLTDHLVLLKGFTQDPAGFQKAVEFAGNAKNSPLRDDGLGHSGSEALDAPSVFLLKSGADFAEQTAAMQQFEQAYQSFSHEISGKITLDAMNALGRAMISIPGRKNLIWFAGNFPTAFFPGDADLLSPTSDAANSFQFSESQLQGEYRDTINLLSKSRIAVYPIDAQGLRSIETNNASSAGYGTVHTQQTRQGLSGQVAQRNESFGEAGEHLAMERIAEDTGGAAFYNSNDLVKGTRDAAASGADFYTLAYAPSDADTKHDYRNIAVKLDQKVGRVGYRRGYYFDTTAKKSIGAVAEAPGGATPEPPSALRQALYLGGPEPTEVLLRVSVLPLNGTTEELVAAGNQPNPDPAKFKGPYKRLAVDIAASPRSMSFSHGADNVYHTSVDFVTYVYDLNGKLVNAQSNTVKTAYHAKEFLEAMRGGILLNQEISVPVKGTYFLRIAVLDHTSGHVGAVEVGVNEVAGLPPAVVAPAAGAGPAVAEPGQR